MAIVHMILSFSTDICKKVKASSKNTELLRTYCTPQVGDFTRVIFANSPATFRSNRGPTAIVALIAITGGFGGTTDKAEAS